MVTMATHPKLRIGSIGRLAYQPAADDGPVPKILDFVRSQLPAWRDDPKRPAHSAERLLNSSLCDFLDNRARSGCSMVRFKHEAPQAAGRTVDIGVHGTEESTFIGAHGYTIYEPFIVIEAKRLPAPDNDREHEYVTGNYKASGRPAGGIQRFKLGLHGGNVQTAAIIGYVEQNSTRYWFERINQWIIDLVTGKRVDGCAWNQTGKLEELVCNEEQRTSTAVSRHQRSSTCLTPSIRIHHLWVVMTSVLYDL
jgi:hypothetical protein